VKRPEKSKHLEKQTTDLVPVYLQQHKYENYKCRSDQNIVKVEKDINNKKLPSNTEGLSDNSQQSH
jgi:hypothetical protein